MREDVRETSRGRHRDEVRSLTLFSSSFGAMRAIPYRSVFGKRTNDRSIKSISLPVQSKMELICSFRLAFVTTPRDTVRCCVKEKTDVVPSFFVGSILVRRKSELSMR